MRLYKRGQKGTWWVDIPTESGRIRRSTGTTNRAQAQELAAKLATGAWRAAKLDEKPEVTWDEALISWLKTHQHLRSIEEIKAHLRWLTPHLRGHALASITTQQLQSVYRKSTR